MKNTVNCVWYMERTSQIGQNLINENQKCPQSRFSSPHRHTNRLILRDLVSICVCVCVWLTSFNCLDWDLKIESNCINIFVPRGAWVWVLGQTSNQMKCKFSFSKALSSQTGLTTPTFIARTLANWLLFSVGQLNIHDLFLFLICAAHQMVLCRPFTLAV